MAGRPLYTHLCVACIIRAMPENEIPSASRGDYYCLYWDGHGGEFLRRAAADMFSRESVQVVCKYCKNVHFFTVGY